MATRNDNVTPLMATHPGTILAYELEERGISQKDFAVMIGMQKSHLNELVKGKRAMSKAVADKIEEALGISSVSLVNMQTQYEHDLRVIGQRGEEELAAANMLRLYDETVDVKTLLKRLSPPLHTAVQKVRYLMDKLLLPNPEDLKNETTGMFRKSAKTGQDPRMLMTWKVLAEKEAREHRAQRRFERENSGAMVRRLADVLHENKSTEERVRQLLAEEGVVFCTVEKVGKASVDGYSFIEDGTPYIILTRRFDRIDNFAFALMHEVGHICLHYADGARNDCRLSIPDYDNESAAEREANEFAANALIPAREWRNAPKVRISPAAIQRAYTQWAREKGLNKWIVLGRISYETGMYKFKSDDSRRIG